MLVFGAVPCTCPPIIFHRLNSAEWKHGLTGRGSQKRDTFVKTATPQQSHENDTFRQCCFHVGPASKTLSNMKTTLSEILVCVGYSQHSCHADSVMPRGFLVR